MLACLPVCLQVYPPRPKLDDPTRFVPSIRWELLRKGSEDAERLLILQQLVAKCKADGACKAKPELAVAETTLAKVDTLVWGFPLTIEEPRSV